MFGWLFGILWISYFLMHPEGFTIERRFPKGKCLFYSLVCVYSRERNLSLECFVCVFFTTLTVRSVLLVDEPNNGHLEATLAESTRPGSLLEDVSANNAARQDGERSRKLSGRTANGPTKSELSTSTTNLETAGQQIDLPNAYVLVVVSEISVCSWAVSPTHPEFCLAI